MLNILYISTVITMPLNLLLDIDECKVYRNDICDTNAKCINTQGSFECQCKTGYQGNGFICKGAMHNVMQSIMNNAIGLIIMELYINILLFRH